MTRIHCVFLALLAAAPAAAQPGAGTVSKASECPAFDPAKCKPLAQLLNAGGASLDPLLGALGSSDQRVRSTAARVVARKEIGAPAAVTARLVAALNQTPEAIRGETLAAIGRLHHRDGLPALLQELLSKNPRNRIYAANGLGEYEVDAARDALIATLKDTVPRVQLAAASNLGRIGDRAAVEPLIDRALVELTAGFVREACAAALGRMKDERALAPLVVLLANEHPTVRSAALRALGALGDRTAIPAILSLTDDTAVAVPLIEALTALADRRGTAALVGLALRSSLPNADRMRALWGLGTLADPGAITGLKPLLRIRDKELVRGTAEALGRIGDAAAVPELVQLLEHRSEQVRRSATWSLQKITGQQLGTDFAAWSRWLAEQPTP